MVEEQEEIVTMDGEKEAQMEEVAEVLYGQDIILPQHIM